MSEYGAGDVGHQGVWSERIPPPSPSEATDKARPHDDDHATTQRIAEVDNTRQRAP